MAPRVFAPAVLLEIRGEWGVMIWSRDHQARFVRELLFARKYVPLHCPEVEEPVLNVICSVLSDRYNHPYNLAFMKDLLFKLKERYELFRYVVNCPYVEYDHFTNIISMHADTEAALRHLRPRSSRYFGRGEPLWDDLKFLFDEPEDFVHDSRVIHPANKIEKIDFATLPQALLTEDEGGRRISAYCSVFNDIYRCV